MTIEELFQKMQWHIEREVKHYKTDFDIDKDDILERIASQRFGQYIWVTRECGTHFVATGTCADDPKASDEFLNAIRRTWPERHEYIITISSTGYHRFQRNGKEPNGK